MVSVKTYPNYFLTTTQIFGLRFDVGIDGELSRHCREFVSVEAVYEAAIEKTEGEPFAQYARPNTDRNKG